MLFTARKNKNYSSVRPSIVAAMLVTSFTLAACGGGEDDAASGGGSDGVTKLSVAVSPGAATSTPMYLAIENGIFEDLGLELDLSVLEDGSVAVPQVLNGQTQFSMASLAGAAQAIDKGLPVKLVGAANVVPTAADAKYQAIIVNKDAGIQHMSDVETWAADSTETDAVQAFSVDALGGDYEALRKVAVPFPAIGDAVADGTVDAALVNEPFLSGALETGDAEVLSYVQGDNTLPGVPGAVVIGSDEYMADNPEITEKFIQGLQEAYEYAQSHLDEVANFVPETGLNDQVPPVIALGEYQQGALDPQTIDEAVDVFQEYGVVTEDLSAESMLYTP